VRPTIDPNPTDVEVYGDGKERVGWTHAGVRAGRPVGMRAVGRCAGRLLAGLRERAVLDLGVDPQV